jgi:LCP family protein required for cell wall assembly
MSETRQAYKKQKKKKRRKKAVIFLLTPFLILLIAATAYGSYLYIKAQSAANNAYEPIKSTKVQKENTRAKTASILFIGVDDSNSRNYNNSTRSDALILATLNEDQKSLKLLSIPRDSYVYVPSEKTYTKINHAHAMGGPQATVETVEELLQIPIDYYVKMNFYAFIEIVDSLNGIEVEVPYNVYEKDTEDNKNAIYLKRGLQTLNGEEALALARTRKKDNDLERGKRQQEIIKAILKKSTSVTSVTKYADIIEAVGNNMKTNLTFDEMKEFAEFAALNRNLSTETLQLKGSDSMKDGVYYYELDEVSLKETQSKLKNHLFDSTPSESKIAQEKSEDEE